MAFSDGPAATAASLTDASPLPLRNLGAVSPVPGTNIRINAFGNITSTSATPTCTLGLYLGTQGSIGSAVVLAISPAMAVSASAVSWPWIVDWEGEVRGIGSTGSVVGQGQVSWGGNTGLAADMANFPMPVTAAGRVVAVNFLNPVLLMLGVTLSSTTGTPSVTCQHISMNISG
jgi:hypothetical protein